MTTAQEINSLKSKYLGLINVAQTVLEPLEELRKITAKVNLAEAVDAVAQFYYFNAGYDACERYDSIEEFKDALSEDEAVDLGMSYCSGFTLASKHDGVLLEIPCMFNNKFSYRTAFGWPTSYLSADWFLKLNSACSNKALIAENNAPDRFNKLDSLELQAISLMYSRLIADLEKTLKEIYECVAQSRAAINSFSTRKHSSTATAFLTAMSQHNALALFEKILQSAT